MKMSKSASKRGSRKNLQKKNMNLASAPVTKESSHPRSMHEAKSRSENEEVEQIGRPCKYSHEHENDQIKRQDCGQPTKGVRQFHGARPHPRAASFAAGRTASPEPPPSPTAAAPPSLAVARVPTRLLRRRPEITKAWGSKRWPGFSAGLRLPAVLLQSAGAPHHIPGQHHIFAQRIGRHRPQIHTQLPPRRAAGGSEAINNQRKTSNTLQKICTACKKWNRLESPHLNFLFIGQDWNLNMP
jgi:hypothetical protein